MPRFPALAATALLAALVLGVAACGSGGDTGGLVADAGGSSPPSFQPAPAPSLWTDDGCSGCHGADGSGGFGPNLHCVDFQRLDTYLRDPSTTHTGGAHPEYTDADLQDLVAFLQTADCAGGGGGTTPPPGGVPSTHTVNEDGVLHHPDYERNLATCTACHGANLEGSSIAPSCASCHGSGDFDDDVGDDESESESESETEAD